MKQFIQNMWDGVVYLVKSHPVVAAVLIFVLILTIVELNYTHDFW